MKMFTDAGGGRINPLNIDYVVTSQSEGKYQVGFVFGLSERRLIFDTPILAHEEVSRFLRFVEEDV